jgi:hypothetical protein
MLRLVRCRNQANSVAGSPHSPIVCVKLLKSVLVLLHLLARRSNSLLGELGLVEPELSFG